uniref:C2H2-type domain-containing protein n=1 Tax=Latimeria chalumnae TaxID=7897 RepID=H3B400_LATCH
MPDVRLPKQLLYSQLSQGQRTRGGQRKHFKDTLKVNIKKCGIDIINWEKLARDRATWRRLVREGTSYFEENRLALELKKWQKREEIKQDREIRGPTLPLATVCSICQRVCGSRIGLFGHQRTHLQP